MSNQSTHFFDDLGGGIGAPTALLKNVGDGVIGTIVEFIERDYVPFGEEQPETYKKGPKSGEVVPELVVVLQTDLRNWANVSKVPRVDPADKESAEKPPSEDDGKRAIYAPANKNIAFALSKAVRAANAGPPVVGGTLGVKVVKLVPTDKGNDRKEHEALYKPPAEGTTFFADTPTEAPAAQEATAPAPAAEPAPAAQDPWATSSAPAASAPPF